MDTGLFVLRVVVGLLLVAHGTKKLSRDGFAGTTRFFGSVGYWPPRAMTRVAAGTEVVGGAALVVGLATPLAAAAVIGLMLNVVAVHRANGLWAVDNGYEFPLTLAAVAATLGFTGPGAASVDAWLGLPAGGLEIGLFTVALGFLAGTAVVLSRVAARSEGGPAAEPPAKEVVIEKIAA